MSTIITLERPNTADAVELITELEAHLESLYPRESRHGYSVEKLLAQGVAFFVLREDDTPAGCGGIQLFGTEYGEIKRMYVRPQFRGLGFGKLILDHLTDHARACGVSVLRLETGIHQSAAIRLYEQMGFQRIPPFGSYVEDPLSLHYEKRCCVSGDVLSWQQQAVTAAFSTTVEALPEPVNLHEKFAQFSDYWSPKVVGELNGQQVTLVKLRGEFIWHQHDNEDELFLVIKGRLRIEFRDRHAWLNEGEFLIVPHGVEHRPVAEEEVHVMLFEPASTLNTGNIQSERTVAELERI